MPDTSANSPLLTIEAATVVRAGRTILDRVSMTIAAGEIVTLVGQNGAGKSTLVKLALGLMRPDSGAIVRQPALRIGYQPQKLAMDSALPLTVRRFLSLTHRAAPDVVARTLAEVGMKVRAEQSIHALSGGELQRVMLARALLGNPGLLVLDEPTQNVDVAGAAEIYRVIARRRDATGCGVLLVSHDLNVVMAQTDRVYCLNGHVCCSGPPADVSRHPEFLRLFGPAAAGMLTIYPHVHDHVHDHDHAHDHCHPHPHDDPHHAHGPEAGHV